MQKQEDNQQVISLTNTPFQQMTRNGQLWVIGRRDTQQLLCNGEFGDHFADMMFKDANLLLIIRPDGTASEFRGKSEPHLEGDCAVVMASMGNYWKVPSDFDKWLEKHFAPYA